MTEDFRGRKVKPGAQVVISPWHLQRHERIWDRPDEFDPDRWTTESGREASREGYLPFSRGARVCPGAGFAPDPRGSRSPSRRVYFCRWWRPSFQEDPPTCHEPS